MVDYWLPKGNGSDAVTMGPSTIPEPSPTPKLAPSEPEGNGFKDELFRIIAGMVKDEPLAALIKLYGRMAG